MAINENQRNNRTNYIGASDVPSILGVDPFKSSYDLWAEKTGKLPVVEKTNKAVGIGKYLEDAILKMSESDLGILETDAELLEFPVKSLPILIAHPDAIAIKTGNPVEAKSTNITRRAPINDEWGKEGTDEVPDRVIIQCIVQCMATNKDVCHNPVIIGGRGYVLFNINYDKQLAEIITNEVGQFWDKNVLRDIPPESMPSIEIAKKMYRQDITTKLDDNILSSWLTIKKIEKSAEETREEIEQLIFKSLGTASAAKCSEGIVTYYMQKRESIDLERLKKELPDVAEKYKKITEYRTLRFKKVNKC